METKGNKPVLSVTCSFVCLKTRNLTGGIIMCACFSVFKKTKAPLILFSVGKKKRMIQKALGSNQD